MTANRRPVDPTFVTAWRELADARRPAERNAALMLAAAQRDLATARATDPASLTGEPGVADPQAAHAEWLALMTESEQRMRQTAAASVAAGRRRGVDVIRRVPAHLAAESAAAIGRARRAIAAMTGPDPDAAAAARHDVLRRWREDDFDAELALVLRFAAGRSGC